ncbi:cytokinin dehydrogenase 3-like protein [Tanacetum coccineum]
MERGFFSQKGSGVERGVKKKDLNRNKKKTSSGIGVSTDSEDTMNDVIPNGVASAVQEGVTPFVVDMTVEMEIQNSLDDTTVPESFPPLSTQVTTMTGNTPGKSLYGNITGKPSGKKVNVRTFFTPEGNGIDVVVPVDSIRVISERFANTAYGFFFEKKVAYPVVVNYVRNTWDAMLKNVPWFIQNNLLILKKWHPDKNLLKKDMSTILVWLKLHGVPVTAFNKDGLSAIATKQGTPLMPDSYTSDMCMQSWGRSSYARVMIELQADVELNDNIVMSMPKITREGHYTCNVRVEYEWKPPRCSSFKVFGHIHEECLKGVEYRPVPKKPTASSSGNKKKGVEPTIEVSNSNPFDVLNSVDNDVEFGTNRGTTNLVNNGATSSGSSFMNVDNSSSGATLIINKIKKFEYLLTSGQAILVDKTGNPLKKVEFSGEYDSEDKVALVDNDMARSMASKRVGFGTQSLLEQWRDSYGQKEWDNPPNIISEQEVANLKAQAKRLFGNENVWVEMHRGISWDKVKNLKPLVTHLKEVEETLGTPMEVEPLDETQLEDLGLNTCNHDIPLSSREVPSFDEPEPQPKPLANCPALDVSLGDERGSQPPIKPHSSDSFRMKVVEPLTIYTPPSPHVTSFHPKDVYCYYRPCVDDLKKHYGFKPGLLGYSGSLGVDFSKLEMIEDD